MPVVAPGPPAAAVRVLSSAAVRVVAPAGASAAGARVRGEGWVAGAHAYLDPLPRSLGGSAEGRANMSLAWGAAGCVVVGAAGLSSCTAAAWEWGFGAGWGAGTFTFGVRTSGPTTLALSPLVWLPATATTSMAGPAACPDETLSNTGTCTSATPPDPPVTTGCIPV